MAQQPFKKQDDFINMLHFKLINFYLLNLSFIYLLSIYTIKYMIGNSRRKNIPVKQNYNQSSPTKASISIQTDCT